MSKDLNQCNFIGRLGADPETKHLPNGDAVCNFTIAVGDDYKDKSGQKVEQTEWVRIVAFRGLADVVGKYLQKGSKVFVSGKYRTRSWEKDGQKHYSTEIVASELQMLDSKNSANTTGSVRTTTGAGPVAGSQRGSFDEFDDDIPF